MEKTAPTSPGNIKNHLAVTKLGEVFGQPKGVRDQLAEMMVQSAPSSKRQVRENLYFLGLLYEFFNTLENEMD